MNKKAVLFEITTILITMVLTFGVFQIQINSWNKTQDYCNEEFGKDNWVLNETTGTDEAPTMFIGQSWKCIEKPMEK